eukprot:CCRYP_005484-RA/>CCRYP_005484-RA protein AED:0.07 eAED:0.07 QI:1906/1/1/1/0.8/0.66/6/96/626
MGRRDHPNEFVGKATAAVASAAAHHWEVEEDHLLSYFLGGDGSADALAAADVAVEKSTENYGDPPIDHSTLRHGTASAPTLEQHSPTLSSDLGSNSFESKSPDSNGILKRSSSMGRSSLSVHFLDNIPEEPSALHDPSGMHDRTGSNGSMHKVPSAASSSSSSLSSMAAALALGGPNQVMYIHQKLQAREIPSSSAVQYNNASPLTPVNMMGSPAGQEMMMLPPPPRFPASTGNGVMHSQNGINLHNDAPQPHYFPQSQVPQSLNVQPQWNQRQIHSPNTQQHLSWIQQMNAACLAAQQQAAEQQAAQSSQMQVTNIASSCPVPSTVVSQPQQPQNIPFRPQQPLPAQHQIQVGVDGATIPVTAITNPDGSVSYHIDPNTSAVPSSGLRFLTKAINEVVKPEETDKEDPAVLAEKRRRRLARNRESARQSRRRKKDHLNNLGEKVKRLQVQLETEVASQINSMETGLIQLRSSLLESLLGVTDVDSESLGLLLQNTSANCSIRRTVILHQYNRLRQAFLSTHNHCSVWLMMRNAQFFVEGSRLGQRPVEAKGSKSSASRPNSKQIGEDIVSKEKTGDNPLTSGAENASRMWPLLCYELTMTMDQEERIINQAHEHRVYLGSSCNFL